MQLNPIYAENMQFMQVHILPSSNDCTMHGPGFTELREFILLVERSINYNTRISASEYNLQLTIIWIVRPGASPLNRTDRGVK